MTSVQNSSQRDNHKTLKHAVIAAGVGACFLGGTIAAEMAILIKNKKLGDKFVKEEVERFKNKDDFFSKILNNYYERFGEAVKKRKIDYEFVGLAALGGAVDAVLIYLLAHGLKKSFERKEAD